MSEAVEAQTVEFQDDGFMWDDDPDAPVDLARIVGRGYNAFWHDRHLYCMLKGSKGSKKSKTVALRWMYLLTEFPQASLLVIRRYGNTLADSCFSDLVWAMNKLHIRAYWRVNKSSLRIRNPDTNQEIHFRGLDDSYKIASIAVEDSYLCWVWFEEFSEITNEEDFLRVTMSIRGKLPPGYFKQFVCSFNPWSENLWFKSKFFDTPREDTFTLTTTFRDNEFLDDVDRQRYLDLYEQNPRMARIICDGDWGIAEGLVYENWKVEEFNLVNILRKQGVVSVFGLDFGFKVSYNAFVAMSIDIPEKKIYVWDEMYERGQTNLQLVKKIAAMGFDREVIWADSAAPLIIHELQEGIPEEVECEDGTKTVVRWSLPNIRGAVKGHDSVMSGIARLQCFQFIVLPKCVNFIHELNNYCYDKDKDGRPTDRPIKDFDHCLVAGTMILTDKGEVPIEDVQVGDMVLTHLGYRKVLASGITRSEPAEIWRATLDDGTVIEGTSDHPFSTNAGVAYLKDLEGLYVVKRNHDTIQDIQVNSVVYNGIYHPKNPLLNLKRNNDVLWEYTHSSIWADDRGWVNVISVEKITRSEYVYDLTVDDAHTFFANGILVLNCMDAARYASSSILVSGKGRVCEIVGGSTPKPSEGTKSKCRRVVSTI